MVGHIRMFFFQKHLYSKENNPSKFQLIRVSRFGGINEKTDKLADKEFSNELGFTQNKRVVGGIYKNPYLFNSCFFYISTDNNCMKALRRVL